MIIRNANINDERRIAILFSEENCHHYNLQPHIFNKLNENEILPKNWLINIINDKTKYLYVAELDDKLVGLILFSENLIDDKLYKQKKYINIDEIIVSSHYRNKGIGKNLIEIVKQHAKKIKTESIRLEVWENNLDAITFYKKTILKLKNT